MKNGLIKFVFVGWACMAKAEITSIGKVKVKRLRIERRRFLEEEDRNFNDNLD